LSELLQPTSWYMIAFPLLTIFFITETSSVVYMTTTYKLNFDAKNTDFTQCHVKWTVNIFNSLLWCWWSGS